MTDDWMFSIASSQSTQQLPDNAPANILPSSTAPPLHADASTQRATGKPSAKGTAAATKSGAGGEADDKDPQSLEGASSSKVATASSGSALPAAEVPTSVKEAVDRFETWSQSHTTVLLPSHEPEALSAQVAYQAPSLEQQQQQQQQHSTQSSSKAYDQQQAQLQQLILAPLVDDQQHYLVGQARLMPTDEGLPSQEGSLNAQTSVPPTWPWSSPPPQPQSSAASFIQATLAAINCEQVGPAAQLQSQPPATQTPTASPGQRAMSASPPAAASRDLEPSTAGQSTIAVASASKAPEQRPPVPSRRPGQVLLTRPGFADAFANPALYQQPWLKHTATLSSGPRSPPRTWHADASSSQQHDELENTQPLFRAGASSSHQPADTTSTHQSFHTNASWQATAEAGTLRPTSYLGTTSAAVAGNAECRTRTLTEPQAAAPAHRHTLRPSPTLTNQPQGHRSHVDPAVSDVFNGQAYDVLGDRGVEAGASEQGARGSRWSAVNAYRQAREAAARAAAGNIPLTLQPSQLAE